jgi:molybdate transport system ATP-binding protein
VISARIGKKIPPALSLDVEFSAPSGVTALFGPEGAGKTLILEAIAGFVRPDSGRILLDDVLLFDAASKISAAPDRRGCAYVSSRCSLFPHMSVRANFAFAALNSPRLERTRRVGEMLELFGLTERAAGGPDELDASERLRAELGRALLSSPKALLLDERPYNEVLLRTVRQCFDGPVLLSTRDLDLCRAAAQALILLDKGRILQRGSPSEVLDNPDSREAARLLDIPNIFECAITALDPGRNTAKLEFEGFSLAAPYIRGHFRGDRITVAVKPADLRVHSGETTGVENSVPAALIGVSARERYARLEFSGNIFADVTHEQYEFLKSCVTWQVEFPSRALRVL